MSMASEMSFSNRMRLKAGVFGGGGGPVRVPAVVSAPSADMLIGVGVAGDAGPRFSSPMGRGTAERAVGGLRGRGGRSLLSGGSSVDMNLEIFDSGCVG